MHVLLVPYPINYNQIECFSLTIICKTYQSQNENEGICIIMQTINKIY